MKSISTTIIIAICLIAFVGLAVATAAETQTGNSLAKPLPTPIPAADARGVAAVASYKRLLALQAKLKTIPVEKQNKAPYKKFLKANEKDIVYSEPSAEYYVRSDLFWKLAEKYKDIPVADEIAWTASQNPLPGECEGFMTCNLAAARMAEGRYLELFPEGDHAKEAVEYFIGLFEPMATDPQDNQSYTPPVDNEDRAELVRLLAEIRSAFANVVEPGKEKALMLIDQVSKRYAK